MSVRNGLNIKTFSLFQTDFDVFQDHRHPWCEVRFSSLLTCSISLVTSPTQTHEPLYKNTHFHFQFFSSSEKNYCIIPLLFLSAFSFLIFLEFLLLHLHEIPYVIGCISVLSRSMIAQFHGSSKKFFTHLQMSMTSLSNVEFHTRSSFNVTTLFNPTFLIWFRSYRHSWTSQTTWKLTTEGDGEECESQEDTQIPDLSHRCT